MEYSAHQRRHQAHREEGKAPKAEGVDAQNQGSSMTKWRTDAWPKKYTWVARCASGKATEHWVESVSQRMLFVVYVGGFRDVLATKANAIGEVSVKAHSREHAQ